MVPKIRFGPSKTRKEHAHASTRLPEPQGLITSIIHNDFSVRWCLQALMWPQHRENNLADTTSDVGGSPELGHVYSENQQNCQIRNGFLKIDLESPLILDPDPPP